MLMNMIMARCLAKLSSRSKHLQSMPVLFMRGFCVQGARPRMLSSILVNSAGRELPAAFMCHNAVRRRFPTFSALTSKSHSIEESDSPGVEVKEEHWVDGRVPSADVFMQLGLKAYYIAQSSNIHELVTNEVYSSRVRSVKDGAAVIALDTLLASDAPHKKNQPRKGSDRSFRFMVVFNYGAIVFWDDYCWFIFCF